MADAIRVACRACSRAASPIRRSGAADAGSAGVGRYGLDRNRNRAKSLWLGDSRAGLRSVSGASRARTGDLLGAIQALSQLSYSPAIGEV
jgi:hypothetical protein